MEKDIQDNPVYPCLLIDILSKRQTGERREEIAENALEAVKSFHAGELKTESADNLIKRLHSY